MSEPFKIRAATIENVPLILNFIKELAEYEKLAHEVTATEDLLRHTLFGPKSNAEVILGYWNEEPVAFAVFFHNFSTFLGKPGVYIEDIYVKPSMRGQGLGQKIFVYLAKLAVERDCGRLEWWVLDWNKSAIGFYKRLGARPMNEWTVYRLDGMALQNLAK